MNNSIINDKGVQRLYPLRDAEDPRKVTLIPISQELYCELYPPIWRTQKQMQRLGRCVCPRSKLWACDADCPICQYRTDGDLISLDTPAGTAEDLTVGDTLMDDAPSPESITIDRAMLELLYQELDELDPEGRRICGLLMDHSEREAAAALGMARSTFKRQWERTKTRLRERLKDLVD